MFAQGSLMLDVETDVAQFIECCYVMCPASPCSNRSAVQAPVACNGESHRRRGLRCSQASICYEAPHLDQFLIVVMYAPYRQMYPYLFVGHSAENYHCLSLI